MAEFHDYRPFGSDVEVYPLLTHYTQDGLVKIELSKNLYLVLGALEAKDLIKELRATLNELKSAI